MGRKTDGKGASIPCNNKTATSKDTAVPVNNDPSPMASSTQHGSKYSKRKLNSNWLQYEEPIDAEDSHGLDFAQFVDRKPSTSDSHFRFSNEKNWELKDKVTDYFKLNVKDLRNEILCVPLHQRLRLDPALLSSDQVTAFNNAAAVNQNNVKEYAPLTQEISNKVLSALKHDANNTAEDISEEENQPWNITNEVKQSVWDESSENFFSLHAVNQELDELLSMPTSTTRNYSEGSLNLSNLICFI